MTYTLPLQPVDSSSGKLLSDLNPDDPTFSNAKGMMLTLGRAAIAAGQTADTVNAYLETTRISADQINTLLGLEKIWDIRQQIMQNNWPTDPAAQAKLIQDLSADAALPPLPLPADPEKAGDSPGLLTVDTAVIERAAASAQQILDDLRAAQAASDADPTKLKMAPMPALDTAGDDRLSVAVDTWMRALGFDVRTDAWTTANLPSLTDPSKREVIAKDTLIAGTVQWPPGEQKRLLTTPKADFYLVAESDGTVTSLNFTGLSDTSKPMQALADEGYDLSFMPASWLTRLYTQTGYTYKMLENGTTKYLVPNSAAPDLPPGYTEPPEAVLLAFGRTAASYWSDGSTVYSIPRSDGVTFTNPWRTPPEGIKLSTGGSLSAALIPLVAQTEDRAVTSEDVAKFTSQALDTSMSRTKGAMSQWTALAQSQQVMLSEAISDYSNVMTFMTNLIQRIEQTLSRVAQAI
ncbi:hypothetical protein [Variovorax sp. KK3]|uniref:hypothetical protein n=1 Tax=Variovorax sp. KK3 TaxID=1855728 RepID=UPI00117E951B|nr:hypothetical protein [Variovorax sp. KK3]